MVTVSPAQGNEVRIIVQRTGDRRLRVAAQGVSKALAVRAAYQGDALVVEMSQ